MMTFRTLMCCALLLQRLVGSIFQGTGTRLGFSSSAYQIEGGWNEDGKGPSVWDTFAHQSWRIKDGSNGDVACDSYHQWKTDLDNLVRLNASAYRFSISWPRILPQGDMSVVNAPGIDYYDKLIEGLLQRNITPMITLFHWDTPQVLQDKYAGWESEQVIDDFTAYSRLCFTQFGDRVKYWITLNEPLTVVQLGYANGNHAPGISEPAVKPYRVAHNMILAHAAVYHVYHDEFYASQGGGISIALNSDFVMPRSDSQEDKDAAQRALLWRMGIFADPLLLGDYPAELRERCGERLSRFNDSQYIQNTIDFFSLNHYTTLIGYPQWNNDYNLFSDAQVGYSTPSGALDSGSSWLKVYPQGMYGMISWMQERYDLRSRDIPLIVTEFGVSDIQGNNPLDDEIRKTYLGGYIQQALHARDELNISIPLLCVWSLMDNFEWAQGYSEKFGVIHVDFEDPARPRTLKSSAYWLSSSLDKGSFPPPLPPGSQE